MTLEEALKKIAELESNLKAVSDNQATALKEATDKQKLDLEEAHKKELQISFNKGFDKSKNASTEDIKNGYVSNDKLEEILLKRDEEAKANLTKERKQATARETLLSLGAKNPSRAMKLIDEADLDTFGAEDFDREKFMDKYKDDIVFKAGDNNNNANFMKNNKEAKKVLSLDEYAGLPKAERMAMSKEDREKIV